MDFKLISEYSPTGDQPAAIKQLVEEGKIKSMIDKSLASK